MYSTEVNQDFLPQMLKSSSQLKMKQACSEMMHSHQDATLKILNKIKSMI